MVTRKRPIKLVVYNWVARSLIKDPFRPRSVLEMSRRLFKCRRIFIKAASFFNFFFFLWPKSRRVKQGMDKIGCEWRTRCLSSSEAPEWNSVAVCRGLTAPGPQPLHLFQLEFRLNRKKMKLIFRIFSILKKL